MQPIHGAHLEIGAAQTVARTVAWAIIPAGKENCGCEDLDEIGKEARKPALGRAGGEHVVSHR